ncbi:MAG: TraE/TraK family type IV conjugative transfer system protein [Pseudomonadota bacterium]
MLTNLKLQRNIVLASAGMLLIANVLLALKLYNQEIITRNLPITEAELVISKNYINDAALKIRADQIISLLFSMKKENSSVSMDHLLRQVDNEFYEEFKIKIKKLAEDIELRDYRYVFGDIQGYEYDNYNWTVKISGYLDTYLSDKRIANQPKQYLLSFTNKSGIINLKSFEEVKDEPKN